MKERIVWVDWMKALLILLVVLGHSGSLFTPVIYLFHIPAFFFISGYLANYSKEETGSLKSSRYMIYAIVIYNLFFIGINALHAYVTGTGIMHAIPGISMNELLVRPLLGITGCYYKDNPMTNPVCAQFWFVWVLIIMKWLYRFFAHRSGVLKITICAMCIVYSCIIYQFNVKTLFYIDRSILAFPFFIVGNMLHKHSQFFIKATGTNYKYLLTTFILIAVIVSVNKLVNGVYPDMFHYRLGHSVLLFYAIAFIGTYAITLFCQFLPKFRIVEIISSGTLLILAIHLYLLGWIKEIPFVSTETTKLITLLIICSLCYPMIVWSNKYIPLLLGKPCN